MKRQQIIDLFTKYGKKEFELWFSGHVGEGEYKAWSSKGQLYIHSFFKNGKKDGEYKRWTKYNEFEQHSLFKNGYEVKNYLL